MAIGCTHGNLIDPAAREQVLAFAERYKPEIRFHLGDAVDVAALRGGARGTPDESRDPRPDVHEGAAFIRRYRPTHFAMGNHDARMIELMESTNALTAVAASSLWDEIDAALTEVKAQRRPYNIKDNWFKLGGYAWGHGFMFNEHALRDHAEMLGPCVIAHLHYPHQATGRNVTWSISDAIPPYAVPGAAYAPQYKADWPQPSYCVGTLANVPAMHYADRRRATLRWGHGVVWGEVCDDDASLQLTIARPGETLRFPL